MKPRLSPSRSAGLYCVVLVFLFSFYLLGLVIGKTLDGDAPASPVAVGEPPRVAPEVARELEFYRDVLTSEEAASPVRREEARPASAVAKAAGGSEAGTVTTPSPEETAAPPAEEALSGRIQEVPDAPTPAEIRVDEPVVEPASARPDAVRTGGFAVQIGALRSREAALDLAGRAEARGYTVEIRKSGGDALFRVWVERGADRERAQGLEKELERDGFPTLLVRVPDSESRD